MCVTPNTNVVGVSDDDDELIKRDDISRSRPSSMVRISANAESFNGTVDNDDASPWWFVVVVVVDEGRTVGMAK